MAVKTMWESGMQNMARVWWSELSLEEEEARRWHLFGLLPLLSTDGSNELTLTKKLKTEVLAGLKELARGYAEIPTPRDLLLSPLGLKGRGEEVVFLESGEI